MRPKSLSATALQTAMACLARFHAEHIVYGRAESGDAALGGTAVHNTLETYVKGCYIAKTMEPSLTILLDIYKMTFMSVFGSLDVKSDDYRDGVKMLKEWHERTDFNTFEVISCEIKEHFDIPVLIGGVKETIPFNFILDRFDKIGPGVYRVNDYKTNRASLSPADLRDKVQARAYGLAMQIKYPDAEKIWVEFDMLRHGGPVGTVFTREDNIDTWRAFKAEAQRIIDTDEKARIPETINDTCGFCVRKLTCGALQRNVSAGGAYSLDPMQRVDQRALLYNQKRAVEAALQEIDKLILSEAMETDTTEAVGYQNKYIITAKSQRDVDADMVFTVIGPELAHKYGGAKITMAAVDKLLEGDELTDEQKAQLRGLIGIKKGQPYVMSKPLPKIK